MNKIISLEEKRAQIEREKEVIEEPWDLREKLLELLAASKRQNEQLKSLL